MNKNEQVEFQILEDFRAGRKTRKQAAMLLGITERSVSRRVAKLRRNGVSGIKHGNCGRTPRNKIDDGLKFEVMNLLKEEYYDFNLMHAKEKLDEAHGIEVSYMTLSNWCREAGIRQSRKRRPSKGRIYRERMSNEGILLQMDGSHHKWNGKDVWCLISVIDDATSNIPAGYFYDGESSWNCLDLLKKLFETRGIPEFLYTDGAGWAGGGGKRQNFSQVVRACEELGIKIIRASSAQAKGRIERSFKTIQDRLVPELRHKKIKSMRDANRYLEQVFLPDWNRRYSVTAREDENRYRPAPLGVDLDDILCMKYDRTVNRDHTIHYEGDRFKLVPGPFGKLRKRVVQVHEYRDKQMKIFYDQTEIEFSKIKPPQRRWV